MGFPRKVPTELIPVAKGQREKTDLLKVLRWKATVWRWGIHRMLLLWLFCFKRFLRTSQSEQGRHCSPGTNLPFASPMALHRNLQPLSASVQPLGLCRGRSPQSCSQTSSLSGIFSYFSLMPRCGLQLESILWHSKHTMTHKLASWLLCGCDLHWLVGMVAGCLVVCERLRGLNQDPLKQVSLLSSFLFSIGPFYFKGILAHILAQGVYSLERELFVKQISVSHRAGAKPRGGKAHLCKQSCAWLVAQWQSLVPFPFVLSALLNSYLSCDE